MAGKIFSSALNACLTLAVCLLAFAVRDASAEQKHIFEGDSFKEAVESLAPGDTLTIHPGTYTDPGRISIRVKGTPTRPVVITAAPGSERPLITRSESTRPQNTINIEGAEHLTIRGLEISSNGGDGVNMRSEPSYITLEDLIIHDIDVGINFRSDMHHIIVRDNEIYNTNGTGEGMYVGCNNAKCSVSESIIERNWVHHTFASEQGDGIEIKNGSHSNLIRDNVIHDTNYPCILVYGSNGHDRNVVEGNVMWNCGNSGIQAAADAVIRNNIIFESPYNGFNSHKHQGVEPANLEFVHNTVIGGEYCIRLAGWDDAEGMVFANNAIYCPDGRLIADGFDGVALSGNVLAPESSQFRANTNREGRSLIADFAGFSEKNVYPSNSSAVLGAGDPRYTTPVDFNGTSRKLRADAGAYQHSGARNPGWTVMAGFKPVAADVRIDFRAEPETVNAGESARLSWYATNVDRCSADGAWSGGRTSSGAETIGPMTESSMFELVCEGPSGPEVRIAMVVVRDASSASPHTELD